MATAMQQPSRFAALTSAATVVLAGRKYAAAITAPLDTDRRPVPRVMNVMHIVMAEKGSPTRFLAGLRLDANRAFPVSANLPDMGMATRCPERNIGVHAPAANTIFTERTYFRSSERGPPNRTVA